MAGAITGFVALPALSVIGLGMIFVVMLGWDLVFGLPRGEAASETAPRDRVALLQIAGADVSKAGGVRIVGRQTNFGLEVSCRGRCDDVTSHLRIPRRIAVTSADGHVLADRDEVWKTRLFAVFPLRPWAVGGEPLAVRDVRRRP